MLIIPGIILALKYWFCAMIIVDRQIDPISALKESSNITNGVKRELFLFSAISLGVNLLGVLCLGVGMLLTIPVTSIAKVYVYRELERAEYPNDEDPAPDQG